MKYNRQYLILLKLVILLSRNYYTHEIARINALKGVQTMIQHLTIILSTFRCLRARRDVKTASNTRFHVILNSCLHSIEIATTRYSIYTSVSGVCRYGEVPRDASRPRGERRRRPWRPCHGGSPSVRATTTRSSFRSSWPSHRSTYGARAYTRSARSSSKNNCEVNS